MSQSKGRQPRIPVAILDLVVLLANLWQGQKDESIGHLDSEAPVKALCKKLHYRRYPIALSAIESALAVCNFRNEKGDFWHPEDKTFAKFLSDLGLEFDREYNLIKKVEEE